MGDCYYIGKSRGRRRFRLKRRWVVLLMFLCLFLFIQLSLYPHVAAVAESEARNRIEKIFHETLREHLSEAATAPLTVTYGTDGRVASATVDTLFLNTVKQQVANDMLVKIGSKDLSLTLPLSSLLGITVFSDSTPSLPVTVRTAEGLSAGYETVFEEKGINQTLLSLRLGISVEVRCLLPGGIRQEKIYCEALLYELLIVGEVPDSFTEISRLTDDVTEYDIDDAVDFGSILE